MKYRRPRLPEHQPPQTAFPRARQLLRSLATTSDPTHVAAKSADFLNSDNIHFRRACASATSGKPRALKFGNGLALGYHCGRESRNPCFAR
jgi:hypothetical protein